MNSFFNFLSYWIGKTYPRWLTKYVPQDKYTHFVSALIGGALLTVLLYQLNQVFLTVIVGTIITSALAAMKEVYDDMHKETHTPDVWDWVASSIGGLVGSLLAYIVV
jgi:VanZ family protein